MIDEDETIDPDVFKQPDDKSQDEPQHETTRR